MLGVGIVNTVILKKLLTRIYAFCPYCINRKMIAVSSRVTASAVGSKGITFKIGRAHV